MTVDAVGFWSYVHEDDAAEEGRIVQLSEHLRNEYQMLTGESLRLFVDRGSIEWGEQWRTLIDEALAGTTFLIPVVTPRYFGRPECRRELLAFAGTARSVDLEELILPIHYVHVDGLVENESARDEAVALVSDRQWEDWRQTRLEDFGSSQYRKAINRLARRLAGIAANVRERPDVQSGGSAEQGGLDEPPEGEKAPTQEGILDLLARGEEALPKLAPLLMAATKVAKSVGESMTRATRRIEDSDKRGRGFAGRLTVARSLAQELNEPAEQLEDIGADIASLVVQIDPAVLTLIRLIGADLQQYKDSEEVREVFATIRGMVSASREAAVSTQTLVSSLEEAATYSRDLQRPIRRMQSGLRGFLDSAAVFEEWDRQIGEIEEASSGLPD